MARSDDGASWGVAVASKFLAVGAYVPAAEAGAGAVASQALANMAYKRDGLALLRRGTSAAQCMAALTGADEQRAERQLGVVDAAGGAATFTGPGCHPWCGGTAGEGYSAQGNILVGPEVVDAMVRTWADGVGQADLGRRLLASLAAGDATGGDRRGRQSAAVVVVTAGGGYGAGDDVALDLRVDDHPAPVEELGRLLDLHDLYFGRTPAGEMLALSGAVAAEVARLLTRAGHPPAGPGPDALAAALAIWAGVENLEERVPPGAVIDPVVLGVLRSRAGS